MQHVISTLENSQAVPQTIKHLPCDPAFPLLGIFPSKIKTCPYTKLVYKCAQQQDSQLPKGRNNPNTHQ